MSERSGIKITTWALMVAVVVGGYVVIRLAPPYIHNFEIQSMVGTAAKFQADPSKTTMVNMYIQKKIHEMELPVSVDDITIEDDGETVRIWVDWETEVAFIPDNKFIPPYKKVYKFHDEATEKVKR